MSSRPKEKGKGSGQGEGKATGSGSSKKGESKNAQSRSESSSSQGSDPTAATARNVSVGPTGTTSLDPPARQALRAGQSFDPWPWPPTQSVARDDAGRRVSATPTAASGSPSIAPVPGAWKESPDAQRSAALAVREQNRRVNYPSSPPDFSRSVIDRETARDEAATSAPASPVKQKLTLAIPSFGKDVPKNDVQREREALKDYRHMLAHAARVVEDFCGPNGWRTYREEQDMTHIPGAAALDYTLATAFASAVTDAIYRRDPVRRYEQFMWGKTRRVGQYLKRQAEDDVESGALTRGDYREFRGWVELDAFMEFERPSIRTWHHSDPRFNEKVAKVARYENITREAAREKILENEFIPRRV